MSSSDRFHQVAKSRAEGFAKGENVRYQKLFLDPSDEIYLFAYGFLEAVFATRATSATPIAYSLIRRSRLAIGGLNLERVERERERSTAKRDKNKIFRM